MARSKARAVEAAPVEIEEDIASEGPAAPEPPPIADTPMMLQYTEIKAANPDCLLFYRMGDFYELFFEDAVVASEALGIALTKRGKHRGEDIPMCGVPVHAADDYLQRLIKRGFRVAVCEQMEDPAEARKRGSKAVVKRDVIRLVTPGTLDRGHAARCPAKQLSLGTDRGGGGPGRGRGGGRDRLGRYLDRRVSRLGVVAGRSDGGVGAPRPERTARRRRRRRRQADQGGCRADRHRHHAGRQGDIRQPSRRARPEGPARRRGLVRLRRFFST